MSNVAAISKIRSKYLLMRWAESILFGLGAGAAFGAILVLLSMPWYLGIIPAAVVVWWRYYYLKLSAVDDLKVSLYINRFYPELKDSSDLLLKDYNSLTSLEQIQLNRINIPEVKLPHLLPQSIAVAAGGLIITFLAINFAPSLHQMTSTSQQEVTGGQEEAAVIDPSIRSNVITITPPAYTQLAKTESKAFSFSTVEGAKVVWNISFHEPVSHAKLTITGGDSIVFNPASGKKQDTKDIEFRYTVSTSALYRIEWTIANETHTTEYNRIDVKPDAIPKVAIRDLPQFTRLKWGEQNTVNVASDIADDYGLTGAHVIATVSKGSGESVKFREEKLAFASPSSVSGKKVTGKLTLDFRKLGMDPGDEVYFYVEAFDNKQPAAQRNRTDTYFIALQDTAVQEMVMDEGLGVDLMPDYFRSQRQLIIDTEKLLAEQKAGKVTKQQFNSTSNELGYDQKVLRLRYGQFLGEEFETSIGEAEVHLEEDEGEKKDDDILAKYGHKHDTENEHNLVADKKQTDQHEHSKVGDKDDPMAAFRHDHDSEEEATFFTMSVKAKLRAALTLMWDSELKLRTYQPKESLPTQYQILKLLKEISNDSRFYVHRMGFDPPPVKEDKRLTGSLEEVKPGKLENKATTDYQYPAMRLALSDISTALLTDPVSLTDQQRTNLHAAGDELAALALKVPGDYLKPLSDLKLIADSKVEPSELRNKLIGIQKAIWTVLPDEAPSPVQRGSGSHQLDVKFMEQIKAKAND